MERRLSNDNEVTTEELDRYTMSELPQLYGKVSHSLNMICSILENVVISLREGLPAGAACRDLDLAVSSLKSYISPIFESPFPYGELPPKFGGDVCAEQIRANLELIPLSINNAVMNLDLLKESEASGPHVTLVVSRISRSLGAIMLAVGELSFIASSSIKPVENIN